MGGNRIIYGYRFWLSTVIISSQLTLKGRILYHDIDVVVLGETIRGIIMENKTQMGLLLIIFGMALSIFGTLGGVAASGSGGTTITPATLITLILGFFGFILLLVGWILMLIGRKEFGEKHPQFAIFSLIAIIIGVIIVIIGSMISTFAGIAGGIESTDEGITLDYVAMARSMKTALIFTQIGGIFITIGWILLVYFLENDIGKKILFLALIASIIISIVAIIYALPVLDDLTDKLEDTPEEEREDEFYEGLTDLNVINGLGVIGSLLLLIGYIIPFNRIKKGELRPITPPPPAYGMPQYPPSYPYQPYPPYQQPPYQPPYQPPQQPQATPEDMTKPEPSPKGAVQPMAVTPEQAGIKKCMSCGSEIPAASTTCPVCKKELKP